MAEENIVKPVTSAPAAPATKPSSTDPDVQIVQTESAPKVEQLQKLTDAQNEPKQVDVDSLVPSDPYYMDPLFHEVAAYFGLGQEEWDIAKNKLSDIVDYVIRDIKSNEADKVLWKIKEIERSLQKPGWDEKRYSNVHKYIRLASRKSALTQAMQAFEK